MTGRREAARVWSISGVMELPLPDFASLTAGQGIAALEAKGWTQLSAGDWSWVLLSPGETQVARVSPWDAAYRLHAELCRRRPIRYVQRVDAILPLGAVGHVVVMERLWPAPDAEAAAFCVALGVESDSGWRPSESTETSAFDHDPALNDLRAHLRELERLGAALPFWGGFDTRPGNVMRDGDGVLKLVDPAFVSGPKIIAAIEGRDRSSLSKLPPGAVAAFFNIPPFKPGGGDELRVAAAEMGLL